MTDPSRPPDIWGDEPRPDPDRFVPDASGRLDPALDPDRFVPEEPDAALPPRLDPARDPDRYRGDGGDRTLTELLGEGAQEDPRDSYVWLVGLLSVLAFLALVAVVASNLGP